MKLFAPLLALVLLALSFGLVEGKAHAGQSATLGVTPNPVAADSFFTASGCGYKPLVGVSFLDTSTGGYWFFGGDADGSGCISISAATSVLGSHHIEACQILHGNHSTLMASTDYQVQ